MKRCLLPVNILLLYCLAFAETHIPGGPVSGNWTLAGSPYLIEGEISIPSGTALLIDPGVEVIFQVHRKFIIEGQLTAVGTESDTILFTASGYHKRLARAAVL